MKALAQAAKDILYNYEQHAIVNLFTFYFTSGTLRWTNHGLPVSYGGNTWSIGPGLVLGEMRSTAGVEVDTCGIVIYPDATTIGGGSMFAAAMAGLFDQVRVTVDRAFLIAPDAAPLDVINEFDGKISQVEPSSTQIRVTVRSVLNQLVANIPSRTTLLSCPYQVYGVACGVNQATFTASTQTTAGSTASVVNVANAARANVGGTLTVNGVTRTILAVNGLAVTVNPALPAAPSSGLTVSITAGCDRLRSTCAAPVDGGTFNNLLRFGGFPDLPGWAEGA